MLKCENCGRTIYKMEYISQGKISEMRKSVNYDIERMDKMHKTLLMNFMLKDKYQIYVCIDCIHANYAHINSMLVGVDEVDCSGLPNKATCRSIINKELKKYNIKVPTSLKQKGL